MSIFGFLIVRLDTFPELFLLVLLLVKDHQEDISKHKIGITTRNHAPNDARGHVTLFFGNT